MLRGGMFGAAAGFVLGLMVRLPLLTVLSFLMLARATPELFGRTFLFEHPGVLACAAGSEILLCLGLVMIPYEWFRGRPYPAKPLAGIAWGVGFLFFVCFRLQCVHQVNGIDGGHAILDILIMLSMVLLGGLLLKDAKSVAQVARNEDSEETQGTREASPEDAEPRRDKIADL